MNKCISCNTEYKDKDMLWNEVSLDDINYIEVPICNDCILAYQIEQKWEECTECGVYVRDLTRYVKGSQLDPENYEDIEICEECCKKMEDMDEVRKGSKMGSTMFVRSV